MAGSVNKVIIIGNLGRDPEVRAMQSGDRVCNLAVATSERWRDRSSGEQRERTEWHRVVIFDQQLVDVSERFLRKGRKVYLEGQLQTRKWTDQSGQDRYTTEVVLQRFRSALVILDSQRDGDDMGASQSYQAPGQAPGQAPAQAPAGQSSPAQEPAGRAGEDLDDEIPF